MEKEENKKKNKIGKRILIIILIIILLLLFFLIGLYIKKLNMLKYVNVPLENIERTEEVEENLTGFKNMILFGINDDENFTGRTGCMILVSLNQETNEVKLTSIYSDTYIEIPGYGYNKASKAYELGGPVLAMSALNRNFDLDIKEYATINFKTIQDVINALGGVEVTISKSEAKQIRGLKEEGTYLLTGEQVHDYQKIIMGATHEFATERMRTILNAGAKKVKEVDLIKLNDALDTLLPQIETNISKIEITKLLTKALNIKVVNSKGWPYEVERIIIDGRERGIAKTLETNVQDLHEELFGEQDYKVSDKVKQISENLIKKTKIK